MMAVNTIPTMERVEVEVVARVGFLPAALAEALAEIIKVRRQQSNFQLIVITHDEEFLQHMNCGELTDDYFKVKRDERQKSVIKVQRISDIDPTS